MANIVRGSNPALSGKIFETAAREGVAGEVMTVKGTVNKTLLIFALLLFSAYYTWSKFFGAADMQSAMAAVKPWVLGSSIVGFIVAIVNSFAPKWSPILTPVYAVLEGLFLGAVSALFNVYYPGIVAQAVGLTIATFFGMLFLYRTGIIKVTARLRSIIIGATFGIALFYLVYFILGLFGVNLGIVESSSGLGIAFSLFVVGLAAFNLLLDFDFIERASTFGAPKYMEWYGAFGLMVTLVWLYIEILRLLSKLRER
jgi:uncharacterized YccA/Bax inhibitor family protein